MSMLVQPVLNRDGVAGYFKRLHELVAGGAGCTEAVVIADGLGVSVGSRFLFDLTGQQVTRLHADSTPVELAERLIPIEMRPRAYHQHGVAYLPVLPRISLLIVGGTKDPNCPYGGAKIAIAAAERAFEGAKAKERLKVMIADVGHQVTAEQRAASLDWFERWLVK